VQLSEDSATAQPNAYPPTARIAAMATSAEGRRVHSAANTLLDGKEKPVGICMHCALDQVSAASARAAPITSRIMSFSSVPVDMATRSATSPADRFFQ